MQLRKVWELSRCSFDWCIVADDSFDNAHFTVLCYFKWLNHKSISSGLAASFGWLCVFVPENQASSIEPRPAEDNDL